MTLRVGVNLLWCDPGRVGGSEQYLVRQLDGLVAAVEAGEIDLTMFAPRSFAAAHPELVVRRTTEVPRLAGHNRAARIAVEHTWLARRTGGRRFDVVHHGGGTAPAVGGRPVVLTIHDLQYRTHPEYLSRTKLAYLRAVVPRSVRRAAVVTTPSEYVRGTVLDAFDVDPDRVMVVPHGYDPPSTDVVDEAAVRARFGLGSGPVLVYPAITHPHKRHRLLLEALARHWTDPDLRLVLLGSAGAAEPDVQRAIAAWGLESRVVRPGWVTDTDRDALLSIADALVFPSGYEGFGAPVLEAMAIGTPVVCSDHPALREVVADAGLVLPPDVDAWAEVPRTVHERRAELVAAGRRRAAELTELTSGAALLAAYRAAVAA
ncbi:MAG: glycosyltransferase family 4 protein [Ilumatobacteraceae bacterium]|nr:glycosyltransferase family 4 protein [Ilumatobacteraceae bacterium]